MMPWQSLLRISRISSSELMQIEISWYCRKHGDIVEMEIWDLYNKDLEIIGEHVRGTEIPENG